MENLLIKTAAAASLMVVFAMAATGCSKTNSSNVKTTGIYVSYNIKGNNQNAATCEVRFQVGGPTGTFLSLEDGDTVTCEGKTMSRNEFAGIVTYSVPVSYNPRGSYNVIFNRPNERPYVATVILPEPITGMSPAAFIGYQKGRPFTVGWSPSSNGGDALTATLSYQAGQTSVLRYKSGGQPETGSVSFGGEDTSTNPPTMGTLSATLTYERVRQGAVPAPLSGHIVGTQTYSVPLQLTD